MNEHHEFRPAQRPDKRSDRPEGRFEARTDGKPERPRRSLRETVCDIDRDILRMLMRRHNLIKRMYNAKGFLEPAEEKSIRESWEAAVSRVSRDPRLSGRFFTLMQEVEFLPRPGEDGEAQRPAFNLAPADMPVRLSMPAPRSCRLTRAWATLAACTGQAVRIAPALMNDPVVDCVKLLNQLGAHANRDDGAVHVAAGTPLGTPDKVLHVGDSSWNFYLALGHYLGRPSRTKFTGGAALKLADLSATRRFLPLMGARLVHVVPKSDGFPVRIECSGVLPGKVVFPADAPVELAEGIMLAAPSYERAITLDLSAMPERALAFARILPVLNAAGADVRREGDVLHFQPCALSIPSEPTLPVEPELAVFLMGLAPALGGEVRLEGQWPTWPGTEAGLDLLRQTGAKVECSATEILARSLKPLAELPAAFALPEGLPASWRPLAVALSTMTALRGGRAVLPAGLEAEENVVESYLHAAGLALDAEGCLVAWEPGDDREEAEEQDEEGRPVRKPRPALQARGWNAPDAPWAVALALAACARGKQEGFKLGNPGVLTELYPPFWVLYNNLPEPHMARENKEVPAEPVKSRRRVITSAVAVPPPLEDEDY